MVEFKLVMGDPVTKKSYKTDIKSPDADQLIGKKIGETFRGELIGLTGYEFQITGGSDKAGFPMHKAMEGIGRRKLFLEGPPCYHPPKKHPGKRKKISVRGNAVSSDIVQINCKVLKAGPDKLEEKFPLAKKEAKEAEAKPAEQPAV
jgi:small subunit ribosomal protein S6e